MIHADPHAYVRDQLLRDERRCAPFHGIFQHKLGRMRPSPLAFLRGAAPMFYAILRDHPELARGPGGEGWIAGDLHLENFGAYRAGSLVEEDKKRHANTAAFDLNDFDDAAIGPWRLDVLRLTTSLLLAGRELHIGGPRALELADAVIDAHVEHACRAGKMPPVPRPVAALLETVRTRTRVQLLDMRTRAVHGNREFIRGARYRDVARSLQKRAAEAFERYVKKLVKEEKVDRDHFEVLDMAFRIAGTGSLGGLRIAVLVSGKGGRDGAWIFDMKEQGTPSASILLHCGDLKRAKRVVTAMQKCLARPPRMLGTTKLGDLSMLVRRLAPQEDKLMLSRLDNTDLLPLARYLGALTGAAHRRGATRFPKKAWSKDERKLLVQHSITLAGIHEAAYLAMCTWPLTAPRRA
jgi:uncharacterized protein (DUF2252 family)